AGMRRGALAPERARFLRQAAQVSRTQLVLGGEVPVEGHFVGSRRFGDGLDPNCPNPVAVKQVGRDRENAVPRRDSFGLSDSCGLWGGFSGASPLHRCYRSVAIFVFPVSTTRGRQSPIPPNCSR